MGCLYLPLFIVALCGGISCNKDLKNVRMSFWSFLANGHTERVSVCRVRWVFGCLSIYKVSLLTGEFITSTRCVAVFLFPLSKTAPDSHFSALATEHTKHTNMCMYMVRGGDLTQLRKGAATFRVTFHWLTHIIDGVQVYMYSLSRSV